jgi:hypothetical protein
MVFTAICMTPQNEVDINRFNGELYMYTTCTIELSVYEHIYTTIHRILPFIHPTSYQTPDSFYIRRYADRKGSYYKLDETI